MFTPITTPPTFVTPEERAQITSSTPASFSDIPPTLRYQDDEVEIIIEPQLDLYGSSDRVKGNIWVTEEAFFFIPTASANGAETTIPSGFSVKYPSITLHAISPASEDTAAYLYCQVDDPSATVEGENDEEDEDDDYVPMRELKVFVKSEAQLNQLFNALSQCAALHPSPMSPGDDLSGQINFFGGNPDEEEDRELPFTITGLPNGADGAFEDAQEDGGSSESTVNGGRTRSDYQAGTERFRPY